MGASLKGGGGVSGFASLQKGNEEVATMTFDPVTGLYRSKDGGGSAGGGSNMSFQQSSGAMGSSGISYQTESSSGIQYNQGVSQLGASFGGSISGGGKNQNQSKPPLRQTQKI